MWTKVIISIFSLVIKSNHIDVSAFLIAYFIKIDKFHWYSANRKIQFQVKKLHLMHLKKLHLSFTLFPIIFALSEPKAQYNPILTFQIINHFVCITTWQFSNLLVIIT